MTGFSLQFLWFRAIFFAWFSGLNKLQIHALSVLQSVKNKMSVCLSVGFPGNLLMFKIKSESNPVELRWFCWQSCHTIHHIKSTSMGYQEVKGFLDLSTFGWEKRYITFVTNFGTHCTFSSFCTDVRGKTRERERERMIWCSAAVITFFLPKYYISGPRLCYEMNLSSQDLKLRLIFQTPKRIALSS